MSSSSKQFNILISGASGYIGSHLINILGDLGKRFVLIDRTFKTNRIKINQHFTVIEADLTSLNSQEIDNRIDLLIHNAYCQNLSGEMNFLSNFHQRNPNARIVFFSSAAVYGDLINSHSKNFTTKSVPHPINDYGRYKLEIEHHITRLTANYQILRISNPYGKEYGRIGVYQIFKSKIIDAIQGGHDEIPLMINYPEPYIMQRDMIPIDQTVTTIKNVIANSGSGAFNIASGRGIYLEDFAQEILQEYCTEKSLDISKYRIKFQYNPYREGEIIKSILG